MERQLIAGLLAVLSTSLHAQNVTTALTALTPLTITTTTGTQTVVPGPLPAVGVLNAPGGPGSVSWTSGATITEAELSLSLSGSGSTVIGPSEILLTIASTGPATMPIRCEGVFDQQTSFGYLQFGVDTGNNGTVDWTYGQSPTFAASASDVSLQPLQLRFLVDYQQAPVSPSFNIRFRLRAVRDGVFAFPMATNCGVYHSYTVGALFDTSVADLAIRSQYLSWHVVGLALSPTLLPPALTLTPQPCLLVPSPDLVVRTGTLFLAVPQALRPIVLHSQLVDFSFAGGLRVSNAYQITLL